MCRSRSPRSASLTANGRDLEYRGIAVETLAKESTFEETTWLLLRGNLPTQKQLADFDAELRQHRKLPYQLLDLLKSLPTAGHPMAALQSGVAALGMYFGGHGKKSPAANWEATSALIAALPTIVAAFHRLRSNEEPVPPRDDLDHAGNFYRCSSIASPRRPFARCSTHV